MHLLTNTSIRAESELIAHRFCNNNKRIFVITSFLAAEQFVYGMIIATPESALQRVYFSSVLLMLCYAFISGYFHRRPPKEPTPLHQLYELSLGALGMAIAGFRFIYLEFSLGHIPTIYVAILYGVAVVFYLPYLLSLSFYIILSAVVIFLLPTSQAELPQFHFVIDILSNATIAWIVSAMNYRSFKRDFYKTRQIERQNEELKNLSEIDSLTRLYNRRKLDHLLSWAHEMAVRYQGTYSLILLDIDFFKKINDTHGHAEGDIVLTKLSDIVCKNIRDVDFCGRWGGEEFLVICPKTDEGAATALAERLRQGIFTAFCKDEKKVTASIGVAEYTQGASIKEVLAWADRALYRAKTDGRNRVVTRKMMLGNNAGTA